MATISTTYLLTKNMRSKWRSEVPEVDEETSAEEEKVEEGVGVKEGLGVEEEVRDENDEPALNDQGKEEDTVIDIE